MPISNLFGRNSFCLLEDVALYNVRLPCACGTGALMQFSDLVRGRNIAIFLDRDLGLLEAIRKAEPKGVVFYCRANSDVLADGIISRTYSGERDVEANNADVLFLGGGTARVIKERDFHSIGHAQFILFPVGWDATKLLFSMQRHLARKRLKFHGTFTFGSARRWLAFENSHAGFDPSSRYYFAEETGARAFFTTIQDLNYCVFDGDHPELRRDNRSTLKLLVHNDDVEMLTRRTTADLGFSPLEIYAPFSQPGHCLKSHISYFPPERALEILARSKADESGIRRASSHDRLLGYCYHLLFHQEDIVLGTKGEILPNSWENECAYALLNRYCDKAGVRRFHLINEMEFLLRGENWFPSVETRAFIARENRFVQRSFANFLHLKPGLAVFVIRQLAADYNMVGKMEEMIAAAGFEILRSAPIPENLRDIVTARFRGGNWALPIGAGLPIHYVVAFDRNPQVIDPKLFVDAIATDNGRLFLKRRIREKAAAIAGTSSFNALHSSDNSCAALEYIEILCPDLYAKCAALVQE